MSQPSSMFVAGDISQTILGAFFLGHPVVIKDSLSGLKSYVEIMVYPSILVARNYLSLQKLFVVCQINL